MYKELFHYFGPEDYQIYLEEFNSLVHEKYMTKLKDLKNRAHSQNKER